MFDHINGGYRARDDLRYRAEQLHVIRPLRRVPHRHEHLRSGPRPGVAREEQRPLPRPHLAVSVLHADLALGRAITEPTRTLEVVVEPRSPFPQHATR